RPEKAAPREMSPPPHALFPLGSAGGMQRLVNEAVTKDAVEVEIGLRVCPACRQRWFLPRCPKCGAHTEGRMRPVRQKIPLRELRPQDVVIPEEAGDFLLKVARFVDELLARMYGLPPYYKVESREGLLGHLVVTLAPHTSGGVLGRLIGFTKARAWFNHPYM